MRWGLCLGGERGGGRGWGWLEEGLGEWLEGH